MTQDELRRLTKEEISRRIREGVKAVLERVLEEEMTEHLAAGYRGYTPSRRGERNGHYTRSLITPVGKIEQLKVPRDRESTFLIEVFERYQRMTVPADDGGSGGGFGDVPARGFHPQGGGHHGGAFPARRRFPGSPSAWRGRPLGMAYPYLYLDASDFKVNWGGWGREGGVEEPSQGFGGAGASGSAAGDFRRPPIHPGGGDGGATWGEVAALGARRVGPCTGRIKRTNVLERLFRGVKRRTGVVGVFPSERSLANLATVVMLRASEDWAFRRYMDMGPLWAVEEKPTKKAT